MLNYFRKHLAHHRLALGVLLLVITATFLAAAMVHLHQTESQAIQQDNQTVQIRKTIEDHLRMYQQMIGTVRAVFLASEEVTADEWRMFLQSAGYPHNCAGMSSLGFVRRIPPDQDKAVPSGRSGSESQSTDVYALTYLSLSDGRMLESSTNLAQFYQHRELLDQAALEGRSLMGTFWGHPRLDGRDPADASESQFLMPQWVIYEPIVEVLDSKTGESRRIKGWVIATLDTRQMLQQLQGKLPGTKVTVPDEPWIATGVRSQLAAQCAQKANQQDLLIPFAGKLLHMHTQPDGNFGPRTGTSLATLIISAGILVAVNLSVVTWSLAETRRRALHLAEQMTLDLRQRENEVRKLAMVAARTDHAVFICDENREIEWINEGFFRLTGMALEDVRGKRVSQAILDPQMDPALLESCRNRITSGKSVNLEVQVRTRDQGRVWVTFDSQGVFDEQGKLTHVIGMMRDVTERKTTEERLLHMSHHDALTGLPNRVMLQNRLQHALQRHQRLPEHRFALIFLDLDRFKLINDSMGHACGDELLKIMARRLTTVLRPTDTIARNNNPQRTVARLGGDEFVVLLEDINTTTDAIRVADRLQHELSSPIVLDGQEVVTTVSMGIALSDLGYTHPEEVLRDADNAMYRAKSQGKARYQVFDQQMHESIKARLALENELRKGIERSEFALVYQPIINLESRETIGFEALVRWRHPQRGFIAPSEFIPIAEETGLIIPLGKWVLLEACRQLMNWNARLPLASNLTISVNLSVKQLGDPELGRTVQQILKATGINPRRLKLEITESAMMEDHVLMSQTLEQLKKLNIQLYMDDFGTGYSSLSCLHRFPIDGLKIDRAFIQSMGQHNDYTAVVQAIVSLAHHLEMTVVAEGLENATQLLQLQTLEADQGQGYFFAMPMSAEAVEKYLSHDGFREMSHAV